MFLLTEMRKFQTKRKSSDSPTWVAWSAILSVAVVVTSVLAVVQSSLMSKNEVLFFNIRAASLEDFRNDSGEPSATLDARTPLVFVGHDKVLVGSVAGVLAPRPDGDVVVLEKEQWSTKLPAAVRGWKRAREVFPARIVAIAAPLEGDLRESAALVGAVVAAVAEVNNGLSPEKDFGAPVPVFVSVKPKMLAAGHSAHAP